MPYRPAKKTGSGDEQIGIARANFFQRRPNQRLLILDRVVVAADKRHHHLSFDAKQLLQKKLSGTYRAVARLERSPRFLFPAKSAEELIEIMHDAHYYFSLICLLCVPCK
jgi:hypothetical protein